MPNNLNIKYIFNKEKILDEAHRLKHDKVHGTFNKKEDFQNKYEYLHKNFPDLFDMIYDDPDNHDAIAMLQQIIALADMYHKKKLSHEDSSKKAGQVLFDKFYTEKKKQMEEDS